MGIEDDFFEAVCKGDIGQVKALLNLIDDINVKDDDGDTALHLAVLYRHYNIVGTLVLSKAKVNTQNNQGWTPLHSAVLVNDFKMVCTLLELCAYPYIKDKEGNLPIHLAAEQGYSDIIGALLDKYVVNRINNAGFTPLHLAVQNRHRCAVETLYYGVANINAQDKEGNTALIMAVKSGDISIVRFLLESGADYNKTNNAGQTFGEFANSKEMISIVSRYDKLPDMDLDVGSFADKSYKRKKLSDISNTTSGSGLCTAHISKRRKISDGSILQHGRDSEQSSLSRSSSSQYKGSSKSMIDISSPESSFCESLVSTVSKCRRFLSKLDLHFSEH